jgi:ribonuclease-3
VIENLQELEEKLGIAFKDKSLLRTALTHSSYRLRKKDPNLVDNERLEFLGDAVLNLCVSQLLYAKFPQDKEGDLTRKRAYLVCKERLSKIAEKLNLSNYLLLGDRERKLDERSLKNISARALEALIGAIFLELGFEKTCKLLEDWLKPYLRGLSIKRIIDYKTKLQEYLQKERGITPTYKVLSIIGPSHKPWIEVAVRVGDEVLAKAKGRSKKEAENKAAYLALKKLKEG